MATPEVPSPQEPSDDQFLEEMVSLTGLFNPDTSWREIEELEDLAEEQPLPPSASDPAEDGSARLPAQ